MKRLDNVSLRQVTNQIETLLSQGFIIDQKRVHLEQNVIQECHMLLEAIHSNASLKQSPGLFQDKSTIYKNITDNIYTIKNLKLKPHFQSGVLPKDLEKSILVLEKITEEYFNPAFSKQSPEQQNQRPASN